MLAQLVYVSTRKEKCDEAEIQSILQSCEKNNPGLGISGVLLYSDQKFLQLVEGESEKLLALYDKIKTDDRHKQCLMVSYGPIKEKSFSEWHMGSLSLEKAEIKYNTNISSEYKSHLNEMLKGEEKDGERARDVIKKFFK